VGGARSAIFAPLENIGLIVIDEEQENTYKSETTPRYHARTVARYRAIQHGAALVLGSATPAVETFHLAETGRSRLLRLTHRAAGAAIAPATVVDMREELQAGNPDIFSRSLHQAMREAFADNRQALLFLNRRGHSGFLLCRACGYVRRCLSCSVSMTLHKTVDGRASMICHYCGRVEPVPDKCPRCGNEAFGRFGAGTQQVEERFLQVFPDKKALRMDQDTTTGRVSHADILDRFGRGEADVLIGTQMIAKGHDYPNVTVAGILSVDLMLGMGDFRAGERAFQLITQAAGRAGRGQAAGKVYIQAYNTDDYAVQTACRQDYEAFYRQEIVYRRTQGYPPFGVIGLVTLLSSDASKAAVAATEISHRIRETCAATQGMEGISVSDPAKAPVYRLRDRYRWRLVVRAAREPQLSRLFSALSERPLPTDVSLSMDIDPYSLM
jgi:primosomal protein N' (replication factor Y)